MKNLLATFLLLVACIAISMPATADDALRERANKIFKPIPKHPPNCPATP